MMCVRLVRAKDVGAMKVGSMMLDYHEEEDKTREKRGAEMGVCGIGSLRK